MKLVTFQLEGSDVDHVGAIIGEDVLAFTNSGGEAIWPSMLDLIEAGPKAWEDTKQAVANVQGIIWPLASVKLRAPIPVPPQYRDCMSFHQHIRQAFPAGALMRAKRSGDPEAIAAAEAATATFELPAVYLRQPVYYKGNRFAVGHPNQVIKWPSYSKVMDFELELACIIGTGGKDISKADARDHIFGFTILNDLSARDAQGLEMEGRLGPAKGKDFDNANVFGPCIVTLDEIGDPNNLKMTARVNDEIWGEGCSADMHWKFEDLIEHISRGETLYPGEVIGSGTVGNGCGLEHQRFLADGDTVELTIEKIGVLKNKIVR